MSDMVEKFIAKGYELERMQEYMDFYLVEDDLVFSKENELNITGAFYITFLDEVDD